MHATTAPRSTAEIALIALAFVLAGLLLFVPLALIFTFALREGLGVYIANILEPTTLHAVGITVLAAVIVVPINMAIGVCIAWLVTRFRFRGRQLVITLIELPASVSPIVAGVVYLFLYGGQGLLGPTLQAMGIQLMFTVTAIIMVSLFVTAPFGALLLHQRDQLAGDEGGGDEQADHDDGGNGEHELDAHGLKRRAEQPLAAIEEQIDDARNYGADRGRQLDQGDDQLAAT